MLEVAAEVAEDVEGNVQAEDLRANGVSVKDFGAVHTESQSTASSPSITSAVNGRLSGNLPSTLVPSLENHLPSAATLLHPIPDHPPPSQRELFEHALQLRMTHLALTEYVEGPESAGVRWLEAFEWYADRRDTSAHARECLLIYILTRLEPNTSLCGH